jgi:hypothetical protein
MRSLLLCSLLCGCSYPDFAFTPEADAAPELDTEEPEQDTQPIDTGNDVSVDVADACAMCGPGQTCVAGACRLEPSCKAIKAKYPTDKSGAFRIDPDGDGPGAPFDVFCEMSADAGGWTLALKADGAKTTFAYDAALWTNEDLLNPTSTDLSTAEAKFRSFNEMAFTQVRVRMFDGTTPRYFVLGQAGSSLRAVFAGGPVATTAGRARWLTLLADPSLQTNCNAEGFNQVFVGGNSLRIRLGIAGNNEADCATANSFIGFGVAIGDPTICYGGIDPGVVVGNAARTSCAAPKDKSTRTVGFLFVR